MVEVWALELFGSCDDIHILHPLTLLRTYVWLRSYLGSWFVFCFCLHLAGNHLGNEWEMEAI